MKSVLILGGTNFIGRNLVEQLLEEPEYEITLFNRQQTHAHLFPETNKIKGDRETEDINLLRLHSWDYVIDLSCYYPKALKPILDGLNKVKKYIFVSTCSVHNTESNRSIFRDEDSEILPCSLAQESDRSVESYGNRKAECERILGGSGLPHTILRPALVYGKYDPTDRLYYWLYQAKHKKILPLPERGERIFSTTYVLDLVEAIKTSLTSSKSSNTFHVVSTPATSIRQIVNQASEWMSLRPETVNLPAAFLFEHSIREWTDIPLWIHGDHFTFSNERMKNELGVRPIAFDSAIEGTLEYFKGLNWPKPSYGISDKKLLQLWQTFSSTSKTPGSSRNAS